MSPASVEASPMQMDPRAPEPAPVRQALTVCVEAPAPTVRATIERLDLAAPVARSLRAFGLKPPLRVAPAALLAAWPLGPDGDYAEIRWRLAAEPVAGDDRCYLTVSTTVTASDPADHPRLLDAWPVLDALCHVVSRRTATFIRSVCDADAEARE